MAAEYSRTGGVQAGMKPWLSYLVMLAAFAVAAWVWLGAPAPW
jgi:hypothetical protein